ncbi:MAG: signal peptidase I [Candidatus Nanopelagicales bacterium]
MRLFGRGSNPPPAAQGGTVIGATAMAPGELVPGLKAPAADAAGDAVLASAAYGLSAVSGEYPSVNAHGHSEVEGRSGWWLVTRRIVGWVSTILMILLLFLAWPLAWGGLFSYTVVAGSSMEPKFHTGDVVMTMERSEYQIGEIIVYTVTFGDKSGAVIHRIVAKVPDGGFKTQGDNNNFVDPWVAEPDNIRGEVIGLFPQGYRLIGLIRSPLFWIIPIGVLVAYFLWPAPVPEEDPVDDEGVEPEPPEE